MNFVQRIIESDCREHYDFSLWRVLLDLLEYLDIYINMFATYLG